LLRGLSAHRRRRANDCRQGDASDQQSHRLTPLPFRRDHKVQIARPSHLGQRSAMVSTKIGQIFSFVQSKVPNRGLSIRREAPFAACTGSHSPRVGFLFARGVADGVFPQGDFNLVR
jgi:hypothetical protein